MAVCFGEFIVSPPRKMKGFEG